MWKLAVILALWACFPWCWQPLRGQAPGVGVDPGHDKKQQTELSGTQTKNDQRGTKDAPLVVDTKGHINTKEEAAEEKKNDKRKALIDRWTVGTAIAGALFTGLLVFVGWRGVRAAIWTLKAVERQATLMERQTAILEKQSQDTKDSVAAAVRAADAAQHGVDVLVNSERAWVLVSHIHQLYFWAQGSTPESRAFLFDITNRGRTVAKLMDFRAMVRYLESGKQLPDAPDYSATIIDNLDPIHGRILAPGDTSERISFTLYELNQESRLKYVMDGDLVLYIYGFIRYFDFAREERKLQFCYRFSTERHEWVIAGPPAYNTHT